MRRRIGAPRKGEFSVVKFQLRWAFPSQSEGHSDVCNIRTFIKREEFARPIRIEPRRPEVSAKAQCSAFSVETLTYIFRATRSFLFFHPSAVNNPERIFRTLFARRWSHVVKRAVSSRCNFCFSFFFFYGRTCRIVHATPVNSSRVFSGKGEKNIETILAHAGKTTQRTRHWPRWL